MIRQLHHKRPRHPLRAAATLVLVLVVAALTLLATPRQAHASSCYNDPLSEYADELDLVIAGRQAYMIDWFWIPFRTDVTLVLAVDRVYKGRAGSVVEVHTRDRAETGGTEFGSMGTTGIAAWYDENNALWVGRCASHHTIAELEEVFGAGYPPEQRLTLPTERAAWTRALWVTTSATAVFVCVVAIRWRRRAATDGESPEG